MAKTVSYYSNTADYFANQVERMIRQQVSNARTDSVFYRNTRKEWDVFPVRAAGTNEKKEKHSQAVLEWLNKPIFKPPCEAIIRMPAGI
jgi:hypothetical protein